jgi:large subunit ribosomal protein L35
LYSLARNLRLCRFKPNERVTMGYKLKTHSGAKKRFKKTASGKVKRGHAFIRHILTSKSTKTKRKLDMAGMVSDADTPKIKRMIPY